MDSQSLRPRALLPSPQSCSPRVTGSSSRPRPQPSPGRGKLGRSAALGAPRLSRRTRSPWLAACLPQGPLTSAARGGWLRRHCAPNMAAADQAAHIRSEEGGRAGERERARKARRRLPAAPVAVAASSRRTRRAPGHPTPILTRFTPTLRKGRGKRRGTSLLESGTRRLPQSPAATALVRGGSGGGSPRTNPLSRESTPTPPPLGSCFCARQAPPPTQGAHTTRAVDRGRCSLMLEPACGGKWIESYS